ncbi:MAG: hypothetical protein K0S76_2680 [Herbinix sp.]|jgi:PmbA protein|nr:hypothetical protein [Herbinix sp.]
MIKELYKEVLRETALNISETRIDAVRKKSIIKSGCRVYKDGFIGVAGCYGEATDDTWAKAEANLTNQIPYPYAPEQSKTRTVDLRSFEISDEQFIVDIETLLADMKMEFPQYILSNKIQITESEFSLANDAGLNLIYFDKTIMLMLLVKHVDSVNIIDSAIIHISRNYDLNKLYAEARKILAGYEKEVTFPKLKKIPVILQQSEMLGKFQESLHGEAMALGSSMFKERMSSKVFHENFHLYQDRSEEHYHVPFFDLEGTTQENDRYPLICEGVIQHTYTDKKSAATYSLPLTGAAGGNYDEVPTLSSPELSIATGNKTLKELLNGELGILAVFISGGDYTSSGDFVSPVQNSYLTDGDHILGRLPECSISGNLYEMFGENYIGFSSDKAFMGNNLLVIRMEVTY